MISVVTVAKYLSNAYEKKYDEKISEMKLHKLLYFAQRESLIVSNTPLFEAVFEGWRFGPVVPSIRYLFSDISNSESVKVDKEIKVILDDTLERYGDKSPWSLSRLSHGEYSWQKSRVGVSEYVNSNNIMSIEDIKIDAKRVKERRQMLSALVN